MQFRRCVSKVQGGPILQASVERVEEAGCGHRVLDRRRASIVSWVSIRLLAIQGTSGPGWQVTRSHSCKPGRLTPRRGAGACFYRETWVHSNCLFFSK